MNKLIIYQYMNRITRDDIIRFGLNQGIRLEEYEVDVIYGYIRNDGRRILNDPMGVLNEAKFKVSDVTYKKMLDLYDKYKDKIC